MKMAANPAKEEVLEQTMTEEDNTIYIGVVPNILMKEVDVGKLFGRAVYLDILTKTENVEDSVPRQPDIKDENKDGDQKLESKFKCDLCEYATDYTSHMKKHKRQKHGGVEIKIVSTMDPVNIGDTKIHRFQCEDGTIVYGCDECDYKYHKKSAIKRHKLRVHTMTQSNNLTEVDPITVNGIKIGVFKSMDGTLLYGCDLCGYKSTEKSPIVRHKECKHFGKTFVVENRRRVEGGFLCDQCEFKTSVLGYLQRHIKRIHEPQQAESEVSLLCDQCSYQGKNSRLLQRHIQEKHSTSFCNQCPYSAPGPIILEAHVNYVHNKISIKCDLCDFEASDKKFMEYHVKSIHEMNSSEVTAGISKDEFGNLLYSCHVCQYHSLKLGLVKEHIEVKHLGIKTKKLLRLKMHRDKRNQLESKCDYCDYVGKSRNVTKHMQGIHLGVKHTCNTCGWQCADPSNLKKHVKSKHSAI